MPNLLIAVCFFSCALPIPFNYEDQRDHIMVVVPNNLADAAVHPYELKDGAYHRTTRIYFGPLLVDLTKDRIVYTPKDAAEEGRILSLEFSKDKTHLALARWCSGSELEAAVASYGKMAREHDERDLFGFKMEVWSCVRQELIATMFVPALDSFAWSKTDNDLLCFSGFDKMSDGKMVTQVWNLKTGDREDATGYLADFLCRVYWSRKENAVYATNSIEGYGACRQWPHDQRVDGRQFFGSKYLGVTPSLDGTYYYGDKMRICVGKPCASGVWNSSDDTPVVTVCADDDVWLEGRWLSDNLFQCQQMLVDCLYDCRNRQLRAVGGVPIWVSDAEKTVAYVDRDRKIRRKELGDCEIVPHEPDAPLIKVGETLECYYLKKEQERAADEKGRVKQQQAPVPIPK